MTHIFSKPKIQASFDQGANSYEKACHVQQQSSIHLIELLTRHWPTFFPKRILDIGTGTGTLIPLLLSLFPKATYLLNDISNLMLQQAQRKFSDFSNIYYQQGDAEYLEFYFHHLIISNFAFQWFVHLPKTLYRLYHHSEILAFTTLTQKTFSTWRDLYQKFGHADPTLSLPSISTLKTWCENLDPEQSIFDTRIYSLTFPSPLAFAKYLKELGAHSSPRPYSSALLSLMKKSPEEITIHYHVFFALLKRSDKQKSIFSKAWRK